ncbi:uncharacterized protein [Anabrus simplex]|uniref:uncharacterized protein n=1 Tax=Anabrus simplex TaxID=316456 RepID=UPI0035A32B16
MDLEVNIKEEPAWLEETTNASLENIGHVSEVIALKKEAKSELTKPESTWENSLEPSEDIKEDLFIEEHTDGKLLVYIKEERKSDIMVSITRMNSSGDKAGPWGTPTVMRKSSDAPARACT